MGQLVGMISEDWRVHGRAWTDPGFHALLVYRIGRHARTSGNRIESTVLSVVHRILYAFVRNLYGLEIPASAQVGRRVRIWHHTGIMIHGASIIGDDCELRQGVTIGVDGITDPSTGRIAPTLERGVSVGAGAVIAGGITIGEGARVGANATVLSDIPAGATAFVRPARVLKLKSGDEVPRSPSPTD